jgi:HD-GYP domain-containing protein (c-di-GMP phosphodiesterase class II)
VRPYKRAYLPSEAFEIIYRDSGIHFDPELVEILRRHEKDFTLIALGRQEQWPSNQQD